MRYLFLTVTLLACTPQGAVLSPPAEELLHAYRQLDQWNPPTARLHQWLTEQGRTKEELHSALLSPNEKGAELRTRFQSLQRQILLSNKDAMLKLQQRARALADEDEREYLLSMLAYWGLNSLLANASRDLQTKSLQSLQDRLRPLANVEEGLSDAHRLYAEVCGRLMAFQPQKVIQLSAEMRQHAARATELDPKNGAAWMSLGSWYLFAPEMSGGNPKRSLKLFQQAERTDLTPSAQVLLLEFKARNYAKLQQVDLALTTLEQGLQIAPAHLGFLRARDRLRQGLPYS